MMLLRLLNPQGIAGIVVSIALALLLIVQKGETRHWRQSSEQFEQLYRDEQSAFAGTLANYRTAAEAAHAADQANLARVAGEQRAINERTSNDFEARLAAARSVAQRLRGEAERAAADRGPGRAAAVPRLSTSAGRTPEAANEDRLPRSDRLTATEQAIQLDELIRWVKEQASIDSNKKE